MVIYKINLYKNTFESSNKRDFLFSILAEKKNMCIHQQSDGIIGKYQHAGFWPKSNIVRPWFPHSKRLNNQQQKVERVSVQHTVNRHKRSQKLIRLLELWPLSQISVSDGSSLQSAWFSHVSVSLSLLLFLFPSSPSLVHVSTVLIIYFLTSLSLWLSDIWARDLVELVLEVSVSQVSHRQRDMLLRQVGVLLGVLDSDIIVREISAFNEHR